MTIIRFAALLVACLVLRYGAQAADERVPSGLQSTYATTHVNGRN